MKRVVAVVIACALTSAEASAQSLFSGAGLGIPMDAVDARSRALGSAGIGLWGTALLPTDPAAAAGITIPTAVFTAQPSWVQFTGEGEARDFQSTRFPLIAVAYPAWGLGTATFSFGSFLDQRYQATRDVVLQLEDGPVGATDSFVSQGGVSEIRLGLSRGVGQAAAVGLQVGRYNGTLTRTLVRSLDGITAEGTVLDFAAGGRWAYSGSSVTGGASMNFGSVGRIAGSLTWSSDLEAEASEATATRGATYAMPLQLRVGGTAVLAPGLAVTASLSSADWSTASDDLTTPNGRSATTYGVGVELARAQLLGRSAPLRFGYRQSDLPFALNGGQPTERVWAAGLGLGLSETASIVLAGLDLAVERGTREEGTVMERFWRAALTLRVAGF